MARPARISVRRLFAYITAICLVLGATASFPDAVETTATMLRNLLWFVTVVGPSILVCLLFSRLSPRPKMTLLTAGLGALAGLYYTPFAAACLDYVAAIVIDGKPRWRGVGLSFEQDALPPTIAAFVCGALSWCASVWQRKCQDGAGKTP